MPPTGSSYPPQRVSLSSVKMPRVSVSSFTKSPTMSAESQRRLLEADRRWRTKSIMRAVAAVLALIGFSVFAAAIPTWDQYFYWGGGPNRGDWEDGLAVGVLTFTFLADIVFLFFTLVRKTSIHPLIPLMVDLHIWAALVPAITFSAGLGMFEYWQHYYRDAGGPFLWHLLHKIGGLELAGVILSCFVWILHFVLFIFACIDTHRWRKARKATTRRHSPRALHHGDLVLSEQADQSWAPSHHHDDDRGLGKDIELSPTSPTAREFV